MAAENTSSNQLTPEARKEINRYLLGLLAAIGIPNLIAIVGAFIYILFVLPKAAVVETKALIQREAVTLSTQVLQESSNALVSTGKAQGTAEALSIRAQEVEKKLKELQEKIGALDKANVAELGKLVDRLEKAPDLLKNLDLVGTVAAIESRLKGDRAVRTEQGFGTGPHINVPRTAQCPEGQIAYGIQVAFGGTCNSQCNTDGGVVREIKLMCRTL